MSEPLKFRLHILWTIFVFLSWRIMETLAKENSPQILFQGANLESSNPDYFGRGGYIRVVRTARNKHGPGLEAFFPFVRDIPMDTNVSFHTYHKINNAYKPTLIKGSVHFCKAVESKGTYERTIFDAFHFPSKCPIKKGNYTMKNYHPSVDDLPVAFPQAEWKNRAVWGTPNKHLFAINVLFKTDRKSSVTDTAAGIAVSQIYG